MKKILIGLVCGLLVVGMAGMGHAGLFGLFGGGGGGKSSRGGSSGPPSEVFQHEFKQLAQSPAPNPGNDGPREFDIKEYLKGHGDDGPYSNRGDEKPDNGLPGPGFNPGTIGDGYLAKNDPPPPNGTPVPEPATMIMLGIGLIGLARYGRNHFNN